MIGIFDTSLPGYEALDVIGVLDAAKTLGMDGVMLSNVAARTSDLDPGTVRSVAAAAAERGLALDAGVGTFNPAQPARCGPLLKAGSGDMVLGLDRVLRTMPALGVKTVFFVVGMIDDRDDRLVSWATQLEGVVNGVKQLAPAIRESGTRLLIKTHEEISSFEILRIIEAVGSDLLGVAHDPVNVACRMEDALECTRRIAPYVDQVHVDDALLTFDGELMRRYLTPLGTGDIDWTALLTAVPCAKRWIEFHRGQFAMPVFDADWVSAQQDLTLNEYRSLLAAALRRLQAAEPMPDQTDVFARLEPTIAWLRAFT